MTYNVNDLESWCLDFKILKLVLEVKYSNEVMHEQSCDSFNSTPQI